MNIFDLLIIQPVFNLLMLIYSIVPGGDFGVTIIIFTLIMRFAMYPLVKKQLHQTKMMRKLQPELKKIKKNAKGNKQLEAMQMMDLYKRHGVSPFRSIGILLLQLPIFIGLYYAVQILALGKSPRWSSSFSGFFDSARTISIHQVLGKKLLFLIFFQGGKVLH